MTDYAALTDPTNPFATAGLSDEVHAILDYLLAMKAAGLDVVCTSTTDHPRLTTAGNISRHVMEGTNGRGLAVDARMRTRGLDTHLAVFDGLALVERQCHELIYAAAPYNIKAGKRVPPYATSGHRDHCHLSVSKGVFLVWPGPKPQPPIPWRFNSAMPKPDEFTSAVACPSGGYWKQKADGAIFAHDGAPYLGAYNQKPELGGNVRYFTALVTTPQGGYIQLANDGAWYRYDPKS